MKTTRMEYSEHIAFWRNKQETHPGERMKTLQYLITLLLFCFLCGCNTPSGDKSATKDESTLGQMVIIPQFSQVQDFDDGLAMVSFDGSPHNLMGCSESIILHNTAGRLRLLRYNNAFVR